MRRIKLVLAALALMVMSFVAVSGPAMANDWGSDWDDWNGNSNNCWQWNCNGNWNGNWNNCWQWNCNGNWNGNWNNGFFVNNGFNGFGGFAGDCAVVTRNLCLG